ncbi:MAG: RnfABCDGE type electron transport complex subunit D [Rikenellaceae bacterium]
MAKKLIVAPSPHLHGGESTRRIMMDVIIALIPAFAISIIYFGVSALCVTAVSVACCLLFEYLISKFLMGKSTSGDLSAVVTGVLLGFNLPANIPLWIVVIGSLVAIGVAKMSFGGIGKNPFNPALVGRVFLLIAYPVQMTSFPRVNGVDVDVFSGATPLSAMKGVDASGFAVNFQDMLFGSIPGSLGEVASLMLILGGVYLLWRKVISWHIPVAVLGSMAAVALIFAVATGYAPLSAFGFSAFHILAGGALLGAIYMATDYSSSPMNHTAMIIYGVGIGVITMMIRLWGAYPEGMSFAILIMNSCVPLLNKYIKPKRFGAQK